jgi:hypothetical protein
MHGNKNYGRAPTTDVSFGGHERGMRETRPASRQSAASVRQRVEAALTDAAFAQLKIVEEKPGFDPYNSGSFDRKHSWARTHRR